MICHATRQRAFYVDGLSLSEPDTYRKVAGSAGLDAAAVVAAFTAPQSQAAADADFRRAAELGVTGFPTLVAVTGGAKTPIAYGHATVDDVEARLTQLRRQHP